MQKIKRWVILILSAVMVAVLMAGCSSTDSLMKAIEKGDAAGVQQAIQDNSKKWSWN